MAGQQSKDYNGVVWDDFVYYDETSPTFLRWKVKPTRSKISVGDVAGYLNNSNGAGGYALLKHKGCLYKAHRVVWILHNGCIDNSLCVDHVNGIVSDNNILNLRLVTDNINNRNRSKSNQNTTGFIGVSFTDKNDQPSFFSHWRDLNGKKKQKWFSCKVYGNEEALRLAVNYRNTVIAEMNNQGAGYTDRHNQLSKIAPNIFEHKGFLDA